MLCVRVYGKVTLSPVKEGEVNHPPKIKPLRSVRGSASILPNQPPVTASPPFSSNVTENSVCVHLAYSVASCVTAKGKVTRSPENAASVNHPSKR